MRLKFFPIALLSATLLLPRTSMPQSADVRADEANSAPEPDIVGTVIGRHTILIARPYDANRAVTSVRFLLDGITLAETGAPGRFDWNAQKLRGGRHVIQVQAFEGQTFIGQSEPLAVFVSDSTPARVLEVPFFTYEDSRRASGIIAPKLAMTYSRGSRISLSQESAERVGRVTVEVFLNGEKQEFAPAARLASAEELGADASFNPKKPVAKRHRTPLKVTPQMARTVWIPARPLLEKLGAQLKWHAGKRTLVADLKMAGGARRLTLTAGQNGARAQIDGRQLQVQSPVRQADNALMVPLSFCEQALDLRVSWRPEARRVEMFTTIYPA